jgi:hypothetical protein
MKTKPLPLLFGLLFISSAADDILALDSPDEAIITTTILPAIAPRALGE